MDVEFSGRMGGIGHWNLMLERLRVEKACGGDD
jgi:hypothetical protein